MRQREVPSASLGCKTARRANRIFRNRRIGVNVLGDDFTILVRGAVAASGEMAALTDDVIKEHLTSLSSCLRLIQNPRIQRLHAGSCRALV